MVQKDLRARNVYCPIRNFWRVLDLDQPMAVLMISLLHFVPDSDDPAGDAQRSGGVRSGFRAGVGRKPWAN